MSTLWILAAEGPNGKFIPGDPKEFWYGGAAFLIVAGLLAWKLSPLISRALAARGESVRTELAAAAAAQEAADAEVAALRDRLGDPQEAAAAIVADAREAAVRLKVDLIARADAEAEAVRGRAVADVAALRSQVASDVQSDASLAAYRAAEEIVRSSLDDATQQQLVDQYIDQVGALS